MTQNIQAFGPQPQLILDDRDEQNLLSTLQKLGSDRRKVQALKRYQIWTEDYASHIRNAIDSTHYDAEVKERIYRHIRVINNLALDVTKAVSQVWRHASSSHVSIEGATPAQNAAFRRLVDETGLWTHARSWNAEAYFCGPVTVIPVMRGGKIRFDTLLPHFYSTVDDPNDPYGAPLAAAWDVASSERIANAYAQILGTQSKATAVVLDGLAWRYFRRTQAGGWELLGVEVHELGEFPGALLDFELCHGQSRWDVSRHQRLVDATIALGTIDAILEFVRKAQGKKFMTFVGDTRGLAKGQTIDTEIPLAANTETASSLSIDIHDLNLDPTYHLRHASWIIQTIARSYGGEASGADLSASIVFSNEVLSELRNEQIPIATRFLRDLLSKTVATAISQRHPLWLDLPSPEAVKFGLNIKHPPLARSFASVREEMEYRNWALMRGLNNFEDLLRPSMPGASEEELRAHLLSNLKSQGEMITLMTTRDQSLAPNASNDPIPELPNSETPAQTQGRIGGRKRAENMTQE